MTVVYGLLAFAVVIVTAAGFVYANVESYDSEKAQGKLAQIEENIWSTRQLVTKLDETDVEIKTEVERLQKQISDVERKFLETDTRVRLQGVRQQQIKQRLEEQNKTLNLRVTEPVPVSVIEKKAQPKPKNKTRSK